MLVVSLYCLVCGVSIFNGWLFISVRLFCSSILGVSDTVLVSCSLFVIRRISSISSSEKKLSFLLSLLGLQVLGLFENVCILFRSLSFFFLYSRSVIIV